MGEILTPAQWDDLRIYLKRKHPDLTDDDMPYYEAEEQDMLCMIEYKIQEYRKNAANKTLTLLFDTCFHSPTR